MDTRIALCDARGPLTDLIEKLSGSEGSKWLRALSKTLRGENPWEFTLRDFTTWKIVKLGTHKTANALKKALMDKGRRISDWALDILKKMTMSPTEVELDLVVISVAELGFPKGATYKDVCDRAHEVGLELCPAEVGPQLRLIYDDQPKDEWLFIAMEAFRDSGGCLRIFHVGRGGGGLWLSYTLGRPGGVWGGGDRFVFVCPRK